MRAQHRERVILQEPNRVVNSWKSEYKLVYFIQDFFVQNFITVVHNNKGWEVVMWPLTECNSFFFTSDFWAYNYLYNVYMMVKINTYHILTYIPRIISFDKYIV